MVEQSAANPARLKWRVIDFTVASVIGVVSALIYWFVSFISAAPWTALESILPGFAGLMNGLWLFAGPLAIIIVRKPGAAIYAEVLGGIVESIIGNEWGGVATVSVAFLQGLGAELAFAFFAYKAWNLAVTLLSGALSGVGAWAYSFFKHLQAINLVGPYGITYLVTTVISGVVFAGIIVWFIYIGIAKTGALDRFESGRTVRNVE